MEWEREVQIAKVDEAQRLVFGVLSEVVKADGSVVVDSQGDAISTAELEQAAYEHVVWSRQADQMHDEQPIGKLVESFVSTPEKRAAMGIGKADDRSVSWWVGYRVEPEVFAKVKSGALRAFSIGGSAIRVPE